MSTFDVPDDNNNMRKVNLRIIQDVEVLVDVRTLPSQTELSVRTAAMDFIKQDMARKLGLEKAAKAYNDVLDGVRVKTTVIDPLRQWLHNCRVEVVDEQED